MKLTLNLKPIRNYTGHNINILRSEFKVDYSLIYGSKVGDVRKLCNNRGSDNFLYFYNIEKKGPIRKRKTRGKYDLGVVQIKEVGVTKLNVFRLHKEVLSELGLKVKQNLRNFELVNK